MYGRASVSAPLGELRLTRQVSLFTHKTGRKRPACTLLHTIEAEAASLLLRNE